MQYFFYICAVSNKTYMVPICTKQTAFGLLFCCKMQVSFVQTQAASEAKAPVLMTQFAYSNL
jgi:hypothetical protein